MSEPKFIPEKSGRAGLWLWVCGWLLAASFVVWHAAAVDRYLTRVSETRFTAEALTTPKQRVPQSIAPDGQTWMRYAMEMKESGSWRLRSTQTDNAPDGRAVYWNSAWAGWLIACAHVRMLFTGEAFAPALENASVWANLPLFLLVMTLASGWVWRRWGGMAGAFVAVGLAGCRNFYEGFYPAYCDHHGLINASVLGVTLGAVMAGAGWWTRRAGVGVSLLPRSESAVMRGLTISAVFGALGLWVSAASLVVTIAFTGLAALAVIFFTRHGEEGGAVCVAAAWRRWGRVGALLSLGFYLLENFPDRLGLRLEANHPLYSLAWWGAGEALAALIIWRQQRQPLRWLVRRLAIWSLLILPAPVVIGIMGSVVFVPLDPFLLRVHSSIHEFESLREAFQRTGWRAHGDALILPCGILVLLIILWFRKSKPESQPEQRIVIRFLLLLVVGAVALGLRQNRWLLTASAPQIVLLGVVLLALTTQLKTVWRGWVLAVAGTLFFVPGAWMLARERLVVEHVRDVQLGETTQLLYRDIAQALRNAGADEHSIILTDPNASVGVGYYGGFRTTGTLYWENRDGLNTAAQILCARDDAEAAGRIHALGIKYVVMVSSYDFLAEYDYALTAVKERSAQEKGFGDRLLYQHRVPVWLRPLNYQVPVPLRGLKFQVEVFAVDFEAPEGMAQQRIGLYQFSKGAYELAEASLLKALATDTENAERWIVLGEFMLARGRPGEAYTFMRVGIDRSPAEIREPLIRTAAAAFNRKGAESQARGLLQMLTPGGGRAE